MSTRLDNHPCSPLLRGDGPETCTEARQASGCAACSPLLRGDGPETGSLIAGSTNTCNLAVPSYGAMALKPHKSCKRALEAAGLAVPSYGAMALKRAIARQHARDKISCSPLLRGDGPETVCSHQGQALLLNLQSPPTGRWP